MATVNSVLSEAVRRRRRVKAYRAWRARRTASAEPDRRGRRPTPLRRGTRAIAARALPLLLGAALSACGPGEDDGEAQIARGQQVFVHCVACHHIDSPASKAGPTLQGMFGRPAAAVPGFAYSEALRRSGIVWNDASLAAFLTDPRGTVPDNRMAFAGLRDPNDVDAIIAFLRHATRLP